MPRTAENPKYQTDMIITERNTSLFFGRFPPFHFLSERQLHEIHPDNHQYAVAHAPLSCAHAPRNLHMNSTLVYTLQAPPNHWQTHPQPHINSNNLHSPPPPEMKRSVRAVSCPSVCSYTDVPLQPVVALRA